jgi:hypothetical protein
LEQNANVVPGLSIPHVGAAFWGFSIEMSVANQVLGRNSSYISVPFLNLMSNLQDRGGGVVIRVGGNTQEFAALVPSLPNGLTFSKTASGAKTTTQTPAGLYTLDMFYLLSNISAVVDVKWFLGIPFNDSVNWRLSIAEYGQQILGDNLLGLQAGNEPDFYQQFGTRPAPYGPQNYSDDIAGLLAAMEANPNIPNKNMLIAPSVASGNWTPEMVWNTGFIQQYSGHLFCLSVEHYPNNNCAAQFTNDGPIIIPQTIFGNYTTHSAAVNLVQPYLNSALLAQQAGKPFYMFETNTASCGGFAGISDSYGAALWAIDYGMQLAYGNFTHGLLHTGGQNSFYNPFTAPPGNQSAYHQWSVGAIYYSAIVMAEAFGTSNTSQIVDLGANAESDLTPAYAIYEKGSLSKVALINFMDDNQTGTHDLQVTLEVTSGVPQSVQVKYLSATSVSDRNNITWAGQNLGDDFTVDGRFRGTLNVVTIQCNVGANTCVIPVQAPGFALVFLTNSSSSSFEDQYISLSQATKTFSTSVFTHRNTATVLPGVLATSNGHSGADRVNLGSTSPNHENSTLLGDAKGGMRSIRPGVEVLVGLVGWYYFFIFYF